MKIIKVCKYEPAMIINQRIPNIQRLHIIHNSMQNLKETNDQNLDIFLAAW